MKILTQIKALVLMCLLGMIATACNTGSDNNGDIVASYPMSSCYASVTEIATGKTTYCNQMSFLFLINWTTGQGAFSFSGLVLDGKTQSVLAFENVPFTTSETTHVNSIITAGATGGNHSLGIASSLTDVNIKWYDRLDYAQIVLGENNRYEPMFVFSFILDGKYRIVGSRQPFLLNGTTTSTAQADNSSYSTDKTNYSVALDFTKETATIKLTGAQFVANMPAQNMEFGSLPFTIAEDGVITIEAADVIPTIANTPQEDFPISNLKAIVTPASGMILDFTCNVRKVAKYDVRAVADYTSYKKDEK